MSVPKSGFKLRWKETTRSNPCRSCKRAGYCQATDDGLVMCRRVRQPGAAERRDCNGAIYYLWRPDGRQTGAVTEAPIIPRQDDKRANAEDLDRIYRALLCKLPLAQDHLDNLRSRGLDDETITRNGYRSMPGRERWRIAADLAGIYRGELLTVPGFIQSQRPGRKPFLSIAGAGPGILIPVRDTQGRIVAMKLRRDVLADDQPRYVYLSSKRHGGPGPGSPPHVPLGITDAKAGTLRITEGELKADVTCHLSRVPTISVPGVSSWRACLPAICQLRPRAILIAWDSDWTLKEDVRRPLVEMLRLFLRTGFRVGLELWEANQGKGIDDLLAAGGRPVVRWMRGGRLS
jgi:hypothetical protein